MDQNHPTRESRPPINLRIKFRSETVEQFIERYAVDVSRGGIFIRTREPLGVGTRLKLDFQFQSGTALMSGDGTVVWIREFDPNRTSVPPGMGVRFDKLTPESQTVLEQLLIEKGKRERSGVPGSASPGAGGIAVRRPSSSFSVLEPQASSPSSPQRPTVAETAAAETAARARTPAATEEPASGPLAAVTSHLSSPSPLPSPSHAQSHAHAGPQPLAAGPLVVAPAAPGASLRSQPDESAPFDDISDEPTQIAGRLPSFLLSDDEATVVAPQASPSIRSPAMHAPSTDPPSIDSPSGTEASRSAPSPREPLPGMSKVEAGPRSPTAKTPEAPVVPVGIRAPALATTAEALAAKRSADEPSLVPVAAAPAASTPNVGDTSVVSSADAKGPATPTVDSAPTAISARPAPATSAAPPTATAAAKTGAAGDKRRSPAAAIGVGVLVLGAVGFFLYKSLSSQTTDTSSPLPVPSTTVTSAEPPVAAIAPSSPSAPAGPTPGQGAVAVPGSNGEAPQPQQPPATTPPPASGNLTAATAQAPGSPPPASAAPQAAPEAQAAVPEPRLPGSASAAGTPGPVAASPQPGAPAPVARKVIVRRKPARPLSSATGDRVAPLAVASEPKAIDNPPAGPAPGAAALTAPSIGAASTSGKTEEPSAMPAGDADAVSHQVRVTSKPDGADVTLDNQVVGTTPYSVGIADVGAPHFVGVRKDGFEPFEQMISSSSAWIKTKPPKGRMLQLLRINARLKPLSGSTGGEPKPAMEPPPAVDPAGKSPIVKPERPLAPGEERPPAQGSPP